MTSSAKVRVISPRGVAATLFVTVLIILAISAAWRAIHIEQQGREKLSAAIALSREMLELKYLVADLNAWQSAYAIEALRGGSAEQHPARAAFIESVHGLRSKLANVEFARLTTEDQREYREVQRALAQYLDVHARTASLERPDGAKLSAMLAAPVLDIAPERTREMVSALADRVVERAERAAAEAARASDQATTWKLVFGVAAIALALVFLVMNVRALMQRLRLTDNVDVLTRTDQVTGVGSRGRWDEEFPLALERARRTERSVAIAMLDLDQFDPNDTNGHLARARMLVRTAKAFATRLREGDLIARYNGEEFGLILHGCGADAAREIIDRVRESLPKGQLMSAGVTESDGHDEPNNVLGRATRALYAAKHAGTNRTVLMRPDATVELQRDVDMPYVIVAQT